MDKIFTRLLVFSLIFLIFAKISAQCPQNYYDKAYGKKGVELQKALAEIITNDYRPTYYGKNGATEPYTDPNTGTTYIPNCSDGDTCNTYKAVQFLDKLMNDSTYDIYSYPCCDINIVNSYGTITEGQQCNVYSFEHAFCQSWFSPSQSNGTCEHNYNYPFPTCSDLHHLFPTDHYINSTYHNNYPYGEVWAAVRISQNGTKMGYPNIACCNDSIKGKMVFEPAKEFKGDIARALLYISVRYMNEDDNFATNLIIDKSQFKPWALEMLKKWHKIDPVSQKEIDRNNTIFAIQHNRNPFIDHPELVELIWGSDSIYDTFGQSGSYDTQRPTLKKINLTGNILELEFSENLEKTSALDVKNYQFTQGLYADSAVCNGNKVSLTLKDIKYNTRYNLYLQNIKSAEGYVLKARSYHFLNGDHNSYYNFCNGPREVLAAWTFDETSALGDSMTLAPNSDVGEPAVYGKSMIYANGEYNSSDMTSSQISLVTTSASNVGDPRKDHKKGTDSYVLQLTKRTSSELALVIKTSTKNKKDIMLTFTNIHTSSGFTKNVWEWSTDGENYHTIETGNTIADYGDVSSKTNWWIREVDCRQIDEIEDKDSLFFRLTLSEAASASGNNKLDNFVIYGEPLDYEENTTPVKALPTDNFSLYPNPNSGEFTIECSHEAQFSHFAIYDITGKMIKKAKILSDKFSVDIKHYPASIYFLKMYSKNGNVAVKKVVVGK